MREEKRYVHPIGSHSNEVIARMFPGDDGLAYLRDHATGKPVLVWACTTDQVEELREQKHRDRLKFKVFKGLDDQTLRHIETVSYGAGVNALRPPAPRSSHESRRRTRRRVSRG